MGRLLRRFTIGVARAACSVGPQLGTGRLLCMLGVGALTAALVMGMPAAHAQAGERITTYGVEIVIEASGDLWVRETIDYDFGDAQRHGIIRDIPIRLRYDDTYDRLYPLEVLALTDLRGTAIPYAREDTGTAATIRIGDPDRTVTGHQAYLLTYRVKGVLNGFPEHVELYWNAIGQDVNVPVERAVVEVSTRGGVVLRAGCFQGVQGSDRGCQDVSWAGRGAAFSHAGLDPFEGLTVVVALAPGAVASTAPILEERWSLRRAFAVNPATVTVAAVLLILVVGAFGRLAWRRGRDRRYAGGAVAIAFGSESGAEQAVPLFERSVNPVEFVPPDGLRPGQIGTLLDEVANPRDVTATSVDLAARGYLTIEELPKGGPFARPDWTLTKHKDPDGLLAYERLLFKALFGGRSEVKLSSLQRKFHRSLKRVQDALYDESVAQGWYARRPDHVRNKWLGLGVLALLAAGGLQAVLVASTGLGLLAVPLVIGAVLLLVGHRWMPQRTAKGTGVRRRLLGFRRFIATAESEPAKFAERKNLFSEYLPYAIVFGVAQKWARAFEGLSQDDLATTWYHGVGPFSALTFSHALSGFTRTSARTMASTAASSGRSGFGGGGYAGGGAGGGGVRSW